MIDKSILLTSTMGNVLGTMRRINVPMLGHKKRSKETFSTFLNKTERSSEKFARPKFSSYQGIIKLFSMSLRIAD